VIQKRLGSVWINDARSWCVDTQQGGERCGASAGIGSGAWSNLQGIVSS